MSKSLRRHKRKKFSKLEIKVRNRSFITKNETGILTLQSVDQSKTSPVFAVSPINGGKKSSKEVERNLNRWVNENKHYSKKYKD